MQRSLPSPAVQPVVVESVVAVVSTVAAVGRLAAAADVAGVVPLPVVAVPELKPVIVSPQLANIYSNVLVQRIKPVILILGFERECQIRSKLRFVQNIVLFHQIHLDG